MVKIKNKLYVRQYKNDANSLRIIIKLSLYKPKLTYLNADVHQLFLFLNNLLDERIFILSYFIIVKDNITIFKGVSNMTTEMNDVTNHQPNRKSNDENIMAMLIYLLSLFTSYYWSTDNMVIEKR